MENMLNTKTVTFKKLMDGYEFIELMKDLNWKYIRYDGQVYRHKGDFSNHCIITDKVKKAKFEGWRYWFDQPHPELYFSEKVWISYTLRPSKQWWDWCVLDWFCLHEFNEIREES